MFRERVSNNIYVFTSEVYAQVTAGAVVTQEGVILIDTLPFPTESREMATFLERASRPGVRYVILTHYHADHTYGSYLFPQADIVAHADCLKLLAKHGEPELKAAQAEEPELEEVTIRLPNITFDEGAISLQLGGRVMRLIHTPGHTPGSIMVYIEDDRVLFASDTVMPVPAIVDGDTDALRASLKKVVELPIENLVQGHGEIILRGEVEVVVNASLKYLDTIEKRVAKAIKNKKGKESLQRIDIESCGLSRIPLNGLVQQIHVANMMTLYDRMTAGK
ncbi:MAG: MBL fold metallo-hydrolase [Anaerolineae bacterium]|nr:MBL fold metallo-hydrolase [Anaerolineae bacterium]